MKTAARRSTICCPPFWRLQNLTAAPDGEEHAIIPGIDFDLEVARELREFVLRSLYSLIFLV